MPIKVKINIEQVIQETLSQMVKDRSLENLAYGAALSKFRAAKNELLSDFDNSSTTKEINEGRLASSERLPSGGSLYSFLGITYPFNPVPSMREYLDNNVKMVSKTAQTKRVWKRKVSYNFISEIPTNKDLYKVDDDKTGWRTGQNWIYNLANSPGNYAYYLYAKRLENVPASRSKRGIQLKKKVRDGNTKVNNNSYVIGMMSRLRKRLEGDE